MDRYSLNGSVTNVASSPGASALGLLASVLTRGKINFFTIDVGGTPADNILDWIVRRCTTTGTATVATPVAQDIGSPASQLLGKSNYTAEPTFTTTLFDVAVHQRSLFQWNAAPGDEILLPAVANNGVVITPIHASYTGSAQATMRWSE